MTIARALTLLALALAPLLAASPTLAQDAPADRFLLVLGHNGSDVEGVADLRYADDDAARFYELLAPGATQAHLLTAFDEESLPLYPHLYETSALPTRERLLGALADIRDGIASARAAGRRTELHVVFSGHGALLESEGAPSAYLTLHDGRWSQADMVAHIIEPELADYTHLVIDACNAYFLVQGRGWESDAVVDSAIDQVVDDYVGFSDVLARHPRVGVLLSTAGAQEVFEWGRYRSGVFSHQLRSALVGAADVDGDGHLRYDEVVAYVAAANVAVRNPDARITATAAAPAQNPDVPLLALDSIGAGAVLQLPEGDDAHYVVEDERGLRYADVTTAGDRPLQIVLTAGARGAAAYYVERDLEEARVEVGTLPPRRTADGRVIATGVPIESLEWSPVLTASRSAVADDFRMNLFAVPFSAAFFYGYHAGVETGRSESLEVNVTTGDGRPRPRFELALGSAIASTSGEASLEAGPQLALRIGRRQGWHARAEFQQAFGIGGVQRRGAVLLGGGAGAAIGPRLVLGGEALVGNQWISAQVDGETRRDNLGLRFEPRAFADVHLGRLVLSAHVGPALQLRNELREGAERSLVVEQSTLSVAGGLQLRIPLGGRR